MTYKNALEEINSYCEAAGIKVSTLTLWALGNSRFLDRFLRKIERADRDIAKIREYMRNNPVATQAPVEGKS